MRSIRKNGISIVGVKITQTTKNKVPFSLFGKKSSSWVRGNQRVLMLEEEDRKPPKKLQEDLCDNEEVYHCKQCPGGHNRRSTL